MNRNVGRGDRAFRLILGTFLVSLPLLVELPGYWGLVPFAIGLVLVVTGALARCPFLKAFGQSTFRTHHQ